MGKKKNKKRLAKCPCCLEYKHRTEVKMTMAAVQKIQRKKYPHFVSDAFDTILENRFWACDSCFWAVKAIKANPEEQKHAYVTSYAYFDSTLDCRTCKTVFTFSKEEKRFWYEDLKFGFYSFPANCLTCRKERRKRRVDNNALTRILSKEITEISTSELERVIAIYDKWNKTNRMNYFKSILIKRKKKSAA